MQRRIAEEVAAAWCR